MFEILQGIQSILCPPYPGFGRIFNADENALDKPFDNSFGYGFP